MSLLVDVNFVKLLCDGYLRRYFPKIRVDDISKMVTDYVLSYNFVPMYNEDISQVAVGFQKHSSSLNFHCKFRSKPGTKKNNHTNTANKCNYNTSSEALKSTMIFKPFLSQILQSHYKKNRKMNPTVINNISSNTPNSSDINRHGSNPNQQLQQNKLMFFQTIAFDIQLTESDCGAKCFANGGYIIQVGILRIPNILMLHHFLETESDNDIHNNNNNINKDTSDSNGSLSKNNSKEESVEKNHAQRIKTSRGISDKDQSKIDIKSITIDEINAHLDINDKDKFLNTSMTPFISNNRHSLDQVYRLFWGSKSKQLSDEFIRAQAREHQSFMSFYHTNDYISNYNLYFNGRNLIDQSKDYDANCGWKKNDSIKLCIDYAIDVNNENGQNGSNVSISKFGCKLYFLKNGTLIGQYNNFDGAGNGARFSQGFVWLDFQWYDYLITISAPVCRCSKAHAGFEMRLCME